MSRGRVRLSAALIAVAGVVGLTGCDTAPVTVDTGGSACYAPLACGPSYATLDPWAAHPFYGYLIDPAHYTLVIVNGHTTGLYRPYSPPIHPVYLRAPTRATVPRPAPPKPAPVKAPSAPKAPAPRPAPMKVSRK